MTKPKIPKDIFKEATSNGEPQVCDCCGKHYLTSKTTYYMKVYNTFYHFCSKQCNDEVLKVTQEILNDGGYAMKVQKWQVKPNPKKKD
jgi:hypothetical protein